MQQERLTHILTEVDLKGSVSVSELSGALQVSEMTIRMDLKLLADRGLLKRTHGGAVKVGESLYKGNTREMVYRNVSSKMAIAKCAFLQIKSGDTIVVDDSSTCLYLIKWIKKSPEKKLHLITNSILAASELLDVEHVKLLLIGGELSGNLASTTGALTERELSEYKADLIFMGANGVDREAGISVIGYPQMMVKKAMLKMGGTVVLLADSHKFGQQYLSVVCPLEAVHLVITDTGIKEELRLELEAAQVAVQIAE